MHFRGFRTRNNTSVYNVLLLRWREFLYSSADGLLYFIHFNRRRRPDLSLCGYSRVA